MNNKKKLCAIFFMIVFCISMFTVNVLAQTTQEKADVLNKLNILKGSSGDYNLSGPLKRTEAATFIVRLMGYEKQVTEKANLYSIFSFPDVDTSKWYSPYVGYCSINKIITGNTEGNFEPDNDISEKSFLKLVLCALGYGYNEDFSWNQVYSKAYDVGLVTNSSYATKTEDNVKFIRSQAAEILYNALTLINQATDKEMFYSLIDNGAITKKVANAAGLIKDEVITEIEDIIATDRNMLTIKFNENVSIDDFEIFESEDESNALDYKIYSQSENEVILKTENQDPGLKYNITIIGATDEDGNVSETMTGSFKGYVFEVEEVESDFFKIKTIEAVNSQTIKVYFTHPVNVNSEMSQYYKIYDERRIFADGEDSELTVKALSSPNNAVTLTLTGDHLDNDAIYSLEIDGNLNSAYGVKLNDGDGDSMEFAATEAESVAFALIEIKPDDDETILVRFNKEINEFLAKQIYNFYITDENDNPIEIEKTAVESAGKNAGKGLFINIKGTFDKDEKYYLVINNLSDASRLEYITEKAFSFEVDYRKKTLMKLDDVDALDNQTLEARFTSPLNESTATNASYYYIKGVNYSSQPEKVFYDPAVDPYTVRLYLHEEDYLYKTKSYKLTVSSKMQDYLGNLIGDYNLKSFDGSSKDAVVPSLKSAVAISSDAVKLTFDREIAFDASNILPSNYTLTYKLSNTEYRKIPLGVLYINASTLILKFDLLKYDTEYNINYTTIKDYCGYVTAGNNASDADFMLVKEE